MSVLDDFNIENHSFKPINKGLGFSTPKPEKKYKTSSFATSAKKEAPKKSFANHLENTPMTMDLKNQIDVKALDAFYKKDEQKPSQAPRKPFQKGMLKEAEILEQSIAFLIDLSFCLGVLYLLNMAILKVLGQSTEFTSIFYFVLDQLYFQLALFGLFYVFYFTLFEPMGTFGKSLLRLETRTFSGKPLRIFESFKRALSSLVCLGLAGTPLLFDWQGRMTQTRVYRRK